MSAHREAPRRALPAPAMPRRMPMPAMPRRGSAGRMAEGLGWFSIGLGVLEIAAAGPLARGLGIRGAEGLLRAYGVREIATGIGILTARDRRPWIMGRVGGDALDVATLLAAIPGNRRPGGVALGLAAVLGVTVLDLVCAEALRTEEVDRGRQRRAVRRYATRSGLPRGVEGSRGAARDLDVPADFRIPEPLRPWTA
ncbi:hypothetical protein [Falsiroseomonas sp. CW058]|uniref:hypothetical protein n=1 Tax=Falsiroseomonas sp. CW058 TaxID=3388664 RepID=UPI003D31277B